MKKLLLLGVMMLMSTTAWLQLSGTYTVNAAGGDYLDLAAFAADLNTNGVSGPVTVNVAEGTYSGNVLFTAYTGMSSANQVSIQADPANTLPAVISHTPASSAEGVIKFQNAEWISVDGLTVEALGGNGRTIYLQNSVGNISVSNCILTCNDVNSSSSIDAVVYGTSLTSIPAGATMSFTNNTITGGSGFYVFGSSASPIPNVNISDNTINAYGRGIYWTYAKIFTGIGNTLNMSASTTTQYGFYVSNGTTAASQGDYCIINNNLIKGNSTSTFYGIYSNYRNGATGTSEIINNMISNSSTTGTGTRYGLYLLSHAATNIYHNSISILDGSATASRAVYMNNSTSTNITYTVGNYDMRNNIISNTGNGYCLEVTSTGSATSNFSTLDYNVYNGNATNPFRWASVNYADLASFQTATSFDANSLFGDPLFLGADDLHCIGVLANDAGDNSAGVLTDIDGDSRPISGSSTVDIGADEFNPASCLPPTGFSVSAVMASTASINWAASASAPGVTYDYYVSTVNSAPSGATAPSGSTGTDIVTGSLTGLTSASVYYYWVRTDCGGSTSPWAFGGSFATTCLPETLPWLEDVEGIAGTTNSVLAASSCWSSSPSNSTSAFRWNVTTNGGTPSSGTGASSAQSGTNYFYIEASSGSAGNVAELYSPFIDVSTLSTPALSFYVHMLGAQITDLRVDVNDGTTWTNDVYVVSGQQQTTQTDAFTQQIANVSTFGSNIQLRFRVISGGTFAGDVCLDDISMIELPSCTFPNVLTAIPSSATSAILGWTENGTATAWNVEWGATGFTQGTGTIVPTTTNPHTITGLSATTTYDFYVQSDCGGATSTWSGPFSFTTPCSAVTAPWSDDVESQATTTNATFAVTDCWTTNPAATTSAFRWNVTGTGTTSSSATGALAANSGSKYYYTEASSGALGAVAELYTPLIDVTALTVPALEFYTHMFGVDITAVSVDVFDGTTWTNDVYVVTGVQQAAQADPFSYQIVNLGAYSGTIQVRFRVVRGSSFAGDVCIDDISVIEFPSCPIPLTPSATVVSLTSITATWVEGGSATLWNVEYGTSGFVQGTGTIVNVNTTPSTTVTGLTTGGVYDFYVQADCGTETSSWVGPFSASITPCTAVPTTTDGTGITSITIGLNTYTATVPAYENFATGAISDLAQAVNASVSAVFNTSTFDYNTHMWIDFNDDLTYDASELVFSGVSGNVAPNTLVMDFTMPASAPLGNHAMRMVGTDGVQTPPNPCYNGSWGSVRDFTVNITPAPACLPPTALSGAAPTPTTANLSWVAGGSELLWNVEYGVTGFVQGTGTVLTGLTVTSAALSGLSAQTVYDFYVQADCGTSTSPWVGVGMFTTPCSTTPAPWIESFTSTTTTPLCWSQSAEVGGPWVFTGNPGYTVSGVQDNTTGTTQDFTWLDFSTPIDSNVILETPLIDVSALTTPELRFFLYSHYAGAGLTNYNRLYVEAFDGTAWQLVHQHEGDLGAAWSELTFNLSSHVYGANLVKIRFRGDNNNDNFGYYNDLLLDDIEVRETPPPSLAVTAMIEGYYNAGTGLMTTVIENSQFIFPAVTTNCDTIIVELHAPTSTISVPVIAGTFEGVLQTDGSLLCSYPLALSGNDYYVVLKHRSAIETWSATPITIGSSSSIDFTVQANVFGGNVKLVNPGVYALYSGDINYDLVVDGSDYPVWEALANSFGFGYVVPDMNGDGAVDLTDYAIWEGNANAFIFVNAPF